MTVASIIFHFLSFFNTLLKSGPQLLVRLRDDDLGESRLVIVDPTCPSRNNPSTNFKSFPESRANKRERLRARAPDVLNCSSCASRSSTFQPVDIVFQRCRCEQCSFVFFSESLICVCAKSSPKCRKSCLPHLQYVFVQHTEAQESHLRRIMISAELSIPAVATKHPRLLRTVTRATKRT